MALVSAKNNSNFVGRLCTDPELKMTASGTEIVNFSLAVDKGWGESKRAIFVRMVAFGPQAKYIAKLSKGSEISCNCEYDIREYTKDNEKRQSHEFTVNDVVAHGRKEAADQATPGQIPLTYASGMPAELPRFEEISSDGALPF